jgi:hypothetical protein
MGCALYPVITTYRVLPSNRDVICKHEGHRGRRKGKERRKGKKRVRENPRTRSTIKLAEDRCGGKKQRAMKDPRCS